jgi:hypothetical protein
MSSATHYLAADPHTRAYAALEGNLAKRIMVGLTGEREPGIPKVSATDDLRCLACHTDPALAAPADQLSGFELAVRREGVGCEACHGAAGGWLHEHTTWTPATRAAGYSRTGMAKLNDIGTRALMCAGCHVGAPADPERGYPVRDMNHDMIAAGHPRLNFDFADYQRSLPPHWHERDRTTGTPRDPDFEVTAWLVGRVAHAEAACRLLADRAARAEKRDPRTPWPEFAEWSCVSCHHRIGDGYPAVAGRALGTPAWQTIWPATRLDKFGKAPVMGDLLKEIEVTQPRHEGVRVAATKETEAFRGIPTFLAPLTAKDVREIFSPLAADAMTDRSLDRDTAGQLFHALAALERSRLGWVQARGEKAEPDPAFDRLRESLTLPRGTLRFDVPPKAAEDLKSLLRR